MGSLHHREPASAAGAGAFAALVLETEQLGCDVIADGAHVHPDWLRLAARVKQSRLILISDRIDVPEAASAIPAWLAADRLTNDGVAWRLSDGRLAGSLLTLDAAIRNVASWNVMSSHDAVAACTLRPARLLGVERQHGTLRAGARADLVALSDAGEVVATWVGGREVFRAKPR
jgi:N-acetylglucosamine-6-phosphate deacetylase